MSRFQKVDDDKEEEFTGPASKEKNAKGEDLMKQAEKKLKSFSLFSGNSKYEEAVELYDKAAAQFKISKNWQEAAECYMECAAISEKLKNTHEANTYYVNAAKAYKNVDLKQSIKVYQLAVEMHMENNRFSSAAKIWKEIAELQEKDMNVKDACLAYQKAADCYIAEDSTSSSNACLLKVANLTAEAEDYKGAIAIYERISKSSLDSQLGKWSVKDYLFKALLCHLVLAAKAGKMVSVNDALDRYKDMYPALEGSRECKLIENAVQAFEADDIDAFTDVVFKYDQIYKLDAWTAKVLLEVKTVLEEGGVGEPDFT